MYIRDPLIHASMESPDPAVTDGHRLGDHDVESLNGDALRIDDLYLSFYDEDLMGMDELELEQLDDDRIGLHARSPEDSYTVIIESDPR